MRGSASPRTLAACHIALAAAVNGTVAQDRRFTGYMKNFSSSLLTAVSLLSLGVTSVLASPQKLDLNIIGIPDSITVPVDSGRGSSADIVVVPSDPMIEVREGRILVSAEIAFPNIDAAIDALMDTNDFRIAEILKYRHGDLVHMRAEGEAGDVLNTRVALRVKNRITRDSHTHHFNVDVDLNWTATSIHLGLDLGPKRGFPNQAEDAIQRELTNREPRFELSQEVQNMGICIEALGFKGAAENGTFAITATLSAPMEILPSLLMGNFPDLDDIFVPPNPIAATTTSQDSRS